jgi:uncharacterized protein (DUF1499 family)
MKRIDKIRLAVGGSLGVIAGLSLVGWKNRRLFLVNDVTSGESDAYPYLRSRVYYADGGGVLAAAEQAVRSLPRFRIVHIDAENEVIEAEAETAVGHFIDDITIYLISLGKGLVRVTIRSRSRQGRGDLGQNAQHIELIQEAMDRRLLRDIAI